MKYLKFTEDAEKMLNGLAHIVLTKVGLEAYPYVKSLENWISTHMHEIEEKTNDQETSK